MGAITSAGRESVLASHSWIPSYMERKTSRSGLLFCPPIFRLAETLSLPSVPFGIRRLARVLKLHLSGISNWQF